METTVRFPHVEEMPRRVSREERQNSPWNARSEASQTTIELNDTTDDEMLNKQLMEGVHIFAVILMIAFLSVPPLYIFWLYPVIPMVLCAFGIVGLGMLFAISADDSERFKNPKPLLAAFEVAKWGAILFGLYALLGIIQAKWVCYALFALGASIHIPLVELNRYSPQTLVVARTCFQKAAHRSWNFWTQTILDDLR